LPHFPTGARVWFTLTPLAIPFTFGPSQQAMAIRARQGGALLLGSIRETPPPFEEPISIRGVSPGCVEPYQNSCFPGATVTHQVVEIAGDTTVNIADGRWGTVPIGGVAYDVSVFAKSVSGVTTTTCADAYTPYGVTLAVVVHDPAPIIAGLEVAGPACAPTAPV